MVDRRPSVRQDIQEQLDTPDLDAPVIGIHSLAKVPGLTPADPYELLTDRDWEVVHAVLGDEPIVDDVSLEGWGVAEEEATSIYTEQEVFNAGDNGLDLVAPVIAKPDARDSKRFAVRRRKDVGVKSKLTRKPNSHTRTADDLGLETRRHPLRGRRRSAGEYPKAKDSEQIIVGEEKVRVKLPEPKPDVKAHMAVAEGLSSLPDAQEADAVVPILPLGEVVYSINPDVPFEEHSFLQVPIIDNGQE